MAHLDAFTGVGRRLVVLDGSRVSIGRGPECQVTIDDDRAVSRLHAVLESLDAGWCLRDLQSRNGTFVNGDRITGVVALRPGDEIQIGAWRLKYCDDHDDSESTLRRDSPSDAEHLSDAPQLSVRERDVLRALAQGATDEQIARELIISISTVRSHLDRIRDKTGCRRRPELILLAIELGIIPPGRNTRPIP